MDAQQFRTQMINKVRAFDTWAYKDQLDSPGDYENWSFADWYDLFITYLEENHND